MRQFLSFFRQFLNPFATSNTRIFVSIAWKMNCDILKSKLILCEWNAFYFIEIAFIGFTLQEIKQCIVCFGTPGILLIVEVFLTYRYLHWIPSKAREIHYCTRRGRVQFNLSFLVCKQVFINLGKFVMNAGTFVTYQCGRLLKSFLVCIQRIIFLLLTQASCSCFRSS